MATAAAAVAVAASAAQRLAHIDAQGFCGQGGDGGGQGRQAGGRADGQGRHARGRGLAAAQGGPLRRGQAGGARSAGRGGGQGAPDGRGGRDGRVPILQGQARAGGDCGRQGGQGRAVIPPSRRQGGRHPPVQQALAQQAQHVRPHAGGAVGQGEQAGQHHRPRLGGSQQGRGRRLGALQAGMASLAHPFQGRRVRGPGARLVLRRKLVGGRRLLLDAGQGGGVQGDGGVA